MSAASRSKSVLVPALSDEAPPSNPPPRSFTLIGRLRAMWPWFAAVLTGVLLCLCYPGHNQGWLVWIALTPLISAVWSLRRLLPRDEPRVGHRGRGDLRDESVHVRVPLRDGVAVTGRARAAPPP